MRFESILGLTHIKNHLAVTADAGRIPHAQLFVGPEGSGALPMAIAYARYLLCKGAEKLGDDRAIACNTKCENLTHPDLHFAFPVATSDTVKSHAVSDHYLQQWRAFIKDQPYGNLFDWYQAIGIENKQGQIGVDEAQDIVKKLSLKSYEGGYKIMIVWMAEFMNNAAANKLLKLIEEPPKDTCLILVVEQEENVLQTIQSRCQALHFPPLSESAIAEGLMFKGATKEEAHQIAHEANGNFNRALDLFNKDSEDLIFEQWFVQWTRTAFKAKGNKGAVQELILWSEEVSKTGRETQKKFLGYCLSVFRQALLLNYKAETLVYLKFRVGGFDLNKFAPFIHENNILSISKELEDALYHIERNGNSRMIFVDLSIKLTRLLHAQAA